jgi:hypothetical protein
MKKIFLLSMVALAVFCAPFAVMSAHGTTVEILYMNHGPMMPTVKDIKNLCSRYGNKIKVAWYDFESTDGEKFMARKGIRQHVPLIIWIDGKSTATINGKEVSFMGFPTGAGPASFQGRWTIADLRMALDQATRKK